MVNIRYGTKAEQRWGFFNLRDVELISVGIRRSNFGFSRVKKIKHSRATVHFFEEESIQKNKSKPGIYYFHVPKCLDKNGLPLSWSVFWF